jgi:hypothetical protein
MPNQNPAVSPFETVTNKKSGKNSKRAIVITICVVVFLILGVVAGVLLVRQQQNIQEKASGSLCPAAAACPVSGQPDLLRNCNTANEDGTPQEVSCSNIGNVGQISACGTLSFCCPSLGASWTTDLTLCATPLSTPTATPTLTPTLNPMFTPTPVGAGSGASMASESATPTASASATPVALATPREIPVTGIDWPTILGVGIGAAAIIGAILLAI